MKKESRFLKYAIIMSLLAGGLCFGLSASAEDITITTGGELSGANYSMNNTLNILNDIELRQGYGFMGLYILITKADLRQMAVLVSLSTM